MKKQKAPTKEEVQNRPGRSKSYYISLPALRFVQRHTNPKRRESKVISTCLERYEALMAEALPDLHNTEWVDLAVVLRDVEFEMPAAVFQLPDVIGQRLPLLAAKVRRLDSASRMAILQQVEQYNAARARGENPRIPSAAKTVPGVRLAARA